MPVSATFRGVLRGNLFVPVCEVFPARTNLNQTAHLCRAWALQLHVGSIYMFVKIETVQDRTMTQNRCTWMLVRGRSTMLDPTHPNRTDEWGTRLTFKNAA